MPADSDETSDPDTTNLPLRSAQNRRRSKRNSILKHKSIQIRITDAAADATASAFNSYTASSPPSSSSSSSTSSSTSSTTTIRGTFQTNSHKPPPDPSTPSSPSSPLHELSARVSTLETQALELSQLVTDRAGLVEDFSAQVDALTSAAGKPAREGGRHGRTRRNSKKSGAGAADAAAAAAANRPSEAQEVWGTADGDDELLALVRREKRAEMQVFAARRRVAELHLQYIELVQSLEGARRAAKQRVGGERDGGGWETPPPPPRWEVPEAECRMCRNRVILARCGRCLAREEGVGITE